jgi:hypothetical protein
VRYHHCSNPPSPSQGRGNSQRVGYRCILFFPCCTCAKFTLRSPTLTLTSCTPVFPRCTEQFGLHSFKEFFFFFFFFFFKRLFQCAPYPKNRVFVWSNPFAPCSPHQASNRAYTPPAGSHARKACCTTHNLHIPKPWLTNLRGESGEYAYCTYIKGKRTRPRPCGPSYRPPIAAAWRYLHLHLGEMWSRGFFFFRGLCVFGRVACALFLFLKKSRGRLWRPFFFLVWGKSDARLDEREVDEILKGLDEGIKRMRTWLHSSELHRVSVQG